MFSSAGLAVQLPGAADAGRVDIDHKLGAVENAPSEEGSHMLMPEAEAPPAASRIKITLNEIRVEGVTAFPKAEIEDLYKPYLGNEVPLDAVWKIANLVTQHYQEAGYFLSRAYVPRQEIGGTAEIRVVEGYVGEVVLADPIAEKDIVKNLLSRIKSDRPIRNQTIEGALLRLNDLPGVSFRSVIEPLKETGKADGAVKLILIKEEKHGSGSVSFDNFNSRYLGPYEGTIGYQTSIIPLQQTSMSFLGGVPLEKLKFFNASQSVPLTADISLQVYGGYTEANPGYTLSSKDIDSNALNIGISFTDKIIRQRLENLSATLSIDGKNNYSDVLESTLSRDRVRAARLNFAYDRADPLAGYDFVTVTLSQGLEILDASSSGEKLISRAGAVPDFTKLEYSATRFQSLGADFTAVTAVSGQMASGVMYSAEQFGYGGQAFGRAYDPSEFIGDEGIAGSVELRYLGLPQIERISFSPYAFYDIGKVWDDGGGSQSGSSAGLGVRLENTAGLSGNFLIAEPLTRKIEDPSSGSGKSPRYLGQILYKF